MSTLKITSANGVEFTPEYKTVDISRKPEFCATSIIDYDGDYIDMRKNSGRTYKLQIFFSDFDTANKFEDETKDVRPLDFFDPLYNINFKALITAISWRHEFVDNVDVVTFNLELQDTQILPVLQPTEAISSNEFKFALKKIKLNLISGEYFNKLVGILDSILSFITAAFMSAQKIIIAVLAQIKRISLAVDNIKKTGIAAFNQAVELFQQIALLPSNFVDMFSKKQLKSFLVGYSDIIVSAKKLISQSEGNALYYAVVAPLVFCKSQICQKLQVQEETRNYLVEIQQTLYDDYKELTQAVSSDKNSVATNNKQNLGMLSVDILTTQISEMEQNLLSALQERRKTLDIDTDIYPLVAQIYPCTTPEEYEIAFARFIEDNELHGEELFMIERGREIKYYV